MTYNKTVLRMMMKFPTLFPTELHCQDSLFLGFGDGYAWNKKGEIILTLKGYKTPTRRTEASIIGSGVETVDKMNRKDFKTGGHPLFFPCGLEIVRFHDFSESFSRLPQVLDGRATPNEDWSENIERFCYDIRKMTATQYRTMMKAYFISHGCQLSGSYGKQDEIKKEVENFKRIKHDLVAKVWKKFFKKL